MLTSILRTVVPALWGSLIGWLLGVVPMLEPLRGELLTYGNLAVPVIAAILIGAWYAFWRWLEPQLPDWLTRILLGSAKTPVYALEKSAYPDIHIDVSQTDDPQAVAKVVAQRIHYETRAAGIPAESSDRVEGPDHRA